MPAYELLLLFFAIALFYSSVGFGGGSSYLAILALFSFNEPMIRLSALVCNIVVVSGGCWIYYRAGHMKWSKIAPLVFASVPLAFLGGRIQLEQNVFFVILGFTLLAAGLMTLLIGSKFSLSETNKSKDPSASKTLGLGGSIGFLSGLVGIGGGIFLSPILHLLKWDSPKVIAATASFYILLNSISGIAGQLSRPITNIDWTLIFYLATAVFVGGQIGSRLGANWLSQSSVRRATAILVIFVAVRILIKYL